MLKEIKKLEYDVILNLFKKITISIRVQKYIMYLLIIFFILFSFLILSNNIQKKYIKQHTYHFTMQKTLICIDTDKNRQMELKTEK